MPHDPRQDEDGSFRKTFAAIAVVHVVVLGSLLLAAFYQPKQSNDSVVWMSPGSFAGDSAAAQAALADTRESSPPPDGESEQPSEREPDQPPPASPPPAPPPPPLPTPQPVVEESALPLTSPTATPPPRSTPTAKPTPKPTPRPTPKPTPKPSPTHSATPKPSPKSPVPAKEKEKRKSDDSPKPRTSPVKSEEKGDASPAPSARQAESAQGKGKPSHDQTTTGRGLASRSDSGSGVGEGKAAGTGNSALGAYVGILTNRFQAAWNQPTSEMALGKTLEVTVKLKVEADGTVTEFVIVEGSGNAVVDDSVREAGKKIARLPPPPGGQAFSAPVRFELGN